MTKETASTNDEEALLRCSSFGHSSFLRASPRITAECVAQEVSSSFTRLRHSVFVILRVETELRRIALFVESDGRAADFKSVWSSSSWSRGLTGIARRISTGFLSSGWTGIAFRISGVDSAVWATGPRFSAGVARRFDWRSVSGYACGLLIFGCFRCWLRRRLRFQCWLERIVRIFVS